MVAGKPRTRKPNLWVQRSKRQTLNYMTLFFIMLLLYNKDEASSASVTVVQPQIIQPADWALNTDLGDDE